MNTGSQQDTRLSPALQPGHFRPDELSLAQRLRQLLQWARHLDFVTLQGQPKGRWSDLLEQDLSLLLAELAALPLPQWQAQAQQFDSLAPAQQRQQCLALARAIDRWHARLLACLEEPGVSPDDPLHAVARLLQDRLAGVLAPQLQALLTPQDMGKTWHPHWGLKPAPHRDLQAAHGAPARPAAGLREHRLLWLSMCRVLAGLQQAAQKALPDSLRSQRHEPAVGLLLALTQVLQHSREPLDRFNDRLTHYYYAQRLGLGREPARPAQVHLLLERQTHAHRPVQLPAGTRFVATQDGASNSFESVQELWLSPLKVSHLLTLCQLQDPDISPERDYGYASSVLAWQGRPPALEDLGGQEPTARPPLGGGGGCQAARQGLALASPLLALQEGQRCLELFIQLRPPVGFADGDTPPSPLSCLQLDRLERQEGWPPCGDSPSLAQWQELLQDLARDCPQQQGSPWLLYLLARCRHARSAPALHAWLGRLFAVWLCASHAELAPDALQQLRRHVAAVLADELPDPGQQVDVDDPLSLLYADQPLERSLVFDRVFRGAWAASLSGAEGWLDLPEVFALPVGVPLPSRSREAAAAGQPGFMLRLELGADQPAVVAARPALHGEGWPALPVLQLRLQSRSRLFASSLLQQLPLEAVLLAVQVRGLRALQLHNQLGRLDPSKPFMPFGPLPEPGAYLMFSHPELAQKPLQSLQLHMRWQGLPRRPWEEHYAGYPDAPWSSQALRVQPAVLVDGQWRDADPEGQGMPLFPAAPLGQPAGVQRLDLDATKLLRLHRSAPAAAAAALDYSLLTRHGHFRLGLAGSPHAFGHAAYPPLLTETLTLNSKLKKPAPLPLAPYTPTLAALEADYAANQRIPARSDGALADGTELRYLGPFGTQPLHALPQAAPRHVLQRWPAMGQLLIGLEGEQPQGPLSLMFKLRAESAQEPLGRPLPRLRWQAWCGDGWQDLEAHRVLLDGTDGLLRTGVITLDLPQGMSRNCPSLPHGPYWLRLLGDESLPLLAGLQGVWTNGLLARLQGPALPRPLAPLSIRMALEPVPGLASVRQPWPSFGEREAERAAGWVTRVSERLRHRGRAAMPWDYERLVLQHFPEVQRVKCIACSDPRGDGRLSVVVVPALPAGAAPDGTEAPKLDAATLARIQRWLQERMPPGQDLLVRNASYERLQVRCSLRLKPGEPVGERLRQLNDALRAYLSPWREGGPTRHFDWQLQVDELEALLRAQPGVAQLGQASVLHIVRDDTGRYTLRDTAVGDRLIRPARPWSLALPTRGHLLELSEHPSPHAPTSGIAKLTLGGSFIIGQDSA